MDINFLDCLTIMTLDTSTISLLFSISGCCIYPLEQLASWYSVIRLPHRFLLQTKDIHVSPAIPGHLAITIHISTSLSWT